MNPTLLRTVFLSLQMAAANEESATPSTNAVALKLPIFWPSQPAIWFTQAEAQFALRNITAEVTKYYYVVDIPSTPPADDCIMHSIDKYP